MLSHSFTKAHHTEFLRVNRATPRRLERRTARRSAR